MESIGNTLQKFLNSTKWKDRLIEIRLREEWINIMGKTISKYTNNITYNNYTITIYTNVPPLKQELLNAKESIIDTINQYFKQEIIKNIIIK